MGTLDLEAPAAAVKPRDNWGGGSVDLVELPTETEYFDNAVAFWLPREQLPVDAAGLAWLPSQMNFAAVTETLAGRVRERVPFMSIS
jgi:periplasmic glucans biosynthesis protein